MQCKGEKQCGQLKVTVSYFANIIGDYSIDQQEYVFSGVSVSVSGVNGDDLSCCWPPLKYHQVLHDAFLRAKHTRAVEHQTLR